MHVAEACQLCAVDRLASLKIENQLIQRSIDHLKMSASLLSEYDRLWHSIHWRSAKYAVKKTIEARLQILAFDGYSQFLAATKLVDLYVDDFGLADFSDNQFYLWKRMIRSLKSADSVFREHHLYQIEHKQLTINYEF